MTRTTVLVISLSLSGCALDWDRFDPRLADVSAADSVTGPDVVADVGPCGSPGLQCCAGGSCETGALCTSNVCRACPMGQIVCGGACVDPQVSNDHCGRCEVQCRGMRTCMMGTCL